MGSTATALLGALLVVASLATAQDMRRSPAPSRLPA